MQSFDGTVLSNTTAATTVTIKPEVQAETRQPSKPLNNGRNLNVPYTPQSRQAPQTEYAAQYTPRANQQPRLQNQGLAHTPSSRPKHRSPPSQSSSRSGGKSSGAQTQPSVLCRVFVSGIGWGNQVCLVMAVLVVTTGILL